VLARLTIAHSIRPAAIARSGHSACVPPCLDVYVLSASRSAETIDAFIDGYASRRLRSDDGVEELMVLPADFRGDEAELDDLDLWACVRVESLEEALNFGLGEPTRAFRLYLRSKDWARAATSRMSPAARGSTTPVVV
jgi:hypothetical protein